LFSEGAWNAMILLNCFFAGLTCVPVYKIGRHLGGEKVAAYASLIWAATFPFFYWPTHWVWETALVAYLMTQLLWMSLQLGERSSAGRWVWFGVLWGASALVNPGVLAVMPALVLWPAWHSRKRGEKWLRPMVMVGVLFFAIVSPWMARNYRVFHKPVFIRSNFGFEFYLGNSELMTGFDEFWKHPALDTAQRDDYVRMGEIAYIESREERAMFWAKMHPADFVKLTGKRIIYYWYGTPYFHAAGNLIENLGFPLFSLLGLFGCAWALQLKAPGAGPMRWVLLFYPVVYYITYPNSRYRHALEPLLTVLAVYLFSLAKLRKTRTA
jgi:4-amino-4-deoxy-L-arabinose transferase-like glycosyltransferase